MKKIAALLMVSLLCACVRQHADTPEEKKEKLMAAMQDFLYKSINYDSSKVKYHVLDVLYFEANAVYDCEYKVNMRTATLDTTGTMSARVSKDMKTVVRKMLNF